jgi:predicted phosphodiesterase
MARVAILADIHGNSPALQAVLDDIKQAGCTCLFVLGDIINGHDPAGSVDLLLSWKGHVQAIQGNAEMYLLTPNLDAFPQSSDPFCAGLIRLLRWFEKRLSPTQLAWLNSLPETIRWNGAIMAHDSPLDRLFAVQHYQQGVDMQYQELLFHSPGIYPDAPSEQLEPILSWMDADAVFQIYVGHTHVPFVTWHGDRLLCNVGSVGMPLDGDPRPAWVLVDQSPGATPIVTIRRIEYEIKTILDIVNANLDYPSFEQPGKQRAYAKMLQTGTFWRTHFNEENP